MKIEKDTIPGVIFITGITIASVGLVACPAPENWTEKSELSAQPTPAQTKAEFPSAKPTLPRETPPSGWKEVTIKRYDRVLLRVQLPQDWNIEEKDQEILVESEATRDLSQIVRIRILMQLSPFESNTFAERIANDQAVEDKDARSLLKLNVRGKEVLSFFKKDETANQGLGTEKHIFGFTFSGVGIGIIIDAPSNRIRDERNNFQRILDRLEPISASSQK